MLHALRCTLRQPLGPCNGRPRVRLPKATFSVSGWLHPTKKFKKVKALIESQLLLSKDESARAMITRRKLKKHDKRYIKPISPSAAVRVPSHLKQRMRKRVQSRESGLNGSKRSTVTRWSAF